VNTSRLTSNRHQSKDANFEKLVAKIGLKLLFD